MNEYDGDGIQVTPSKGESAWIRDYTVLAVTTRWGTLYVLSRVVDSPHDPWWKWRYYLIRWMCRR